MPHVIHSPTPPRKGTPTRKQRASGAPPEGTPTRKQRASGAPPKGTPTRKQRASGAPPKGRAAGTPARDAQAIYRLLALLTAIAFVLMALYASVRLAAMIA